jgi:hypothetical protein
MDKQARMAQINGLIVEARDLLDISDEGCLFEEIQAIEDARDNFDCLLSA